MGTSNIIGNLTAGNDQAAQAGILKAGIPVTNNAGPSLGAKPVSSPAVNNLLDPSTNPYVTPGTPLSTVGTVPVLGAIPGTPSPTGGVSGVNSGDLNKQLTDTFGKGEGSLLDSVIGNIGSNDSSYFQAYQAAMAPANAENLATLNTTLGNEGVSGNSSTAAIANADFQSNVSTQTGLQEQQLQMNDLSQLLGLTEGLEGPSASEVSSGGFLNDLGAIAGDVGSVLHGGSGVSNLGSSIGASASSGSSTSPQANQLSDSALFDTTDAAQAIPTEDSSLAELL